MIPIRKSVIAWDCESKRVAVLFHCVESKRYCGPEFDRLRMTCDMGATSDYWSHRPTGYLAAALFSIALELICRDGFNPKDVLGELSKIQELNKVLNKGEHMDNALNW
jgi:hypothetical protein